LNLESQNLIQYKYKYVYFRHTALGGTFKQYQEDQNLLNGWLELMSDLVEGMPGSYKAQRCLHLMDSKKA
jgi:hypothetical protein